MKPNLINALIYKTPEKTWKSNPRLSLEQNKQMQKLSKQLNQFVSQMPPGSGNRMDYVDGIYEFNVDAKFKILSRDDSGFFKFNTQGTSCVLSLYNMVQGIYNTQSFDIPGSLKSEDYDMLPESKILNLPRDYEQAALEIERKYIGKTFRVVAKSPKGSTRYGGCYYIFAIED